MDIRSHRINQKIRLGDLAKLAGVPLNSLKRWERGFDLPSARELKAIATALNCDVKALTQGQKKFGRKNVPGEGYTTAKTESIQVFPRKRLPPVGKLKVLDLFCGAGGFSYGFEQTGRFVVTAGLDLLPDRIETFQKNHLSATSIIGDIRKYPSDKLIQEAMNPDVIIGGPPCQGFSSIRPFRVLTEGDPRNNLVENFWLTIKAAHPDWFVMENVVGLIKHEGGDTLKGILAAFESLGYSLSWKIVNAAFYGLPQNRERFILVGNSRGVEFQWPTPTHETKHRSMAGKAVPQIQINPLFNQDVKPAVTAWEAISDLPSLKAGEETDTYQKQAVVGSYAHKLRNGATRLTLHNATAHSARMMEIIRQSGSNRAALPANLTRSGFSTCYSRLDPDRPSVTLTVNFVHPASNKCIHPFQDRALTPREGARLQGFPDDFIFSGTRSQIVKQIGNAVPPLLGRIIAEGIWISIANERSEAFGKTYKVGQFAGVGSN